MASGRLCAARILTRRRADTLLDLDWRCIRCQYQSEVSMKAAVFTMKLEPDLRAEFMAAAEAAHRPASQVVRELMRDYVQRQQTQKDHSAFLHRKVEVARASVRAARGRSGETVEAEFSARRSQLADDE